MKIRTVIACAAFIGTSASFSQELKIATWNLEWHSGALTQAEYAACIRLTQNERDKLDEVHAYRWVCKSEEQIKAMRAVAKEIDADIIAVQEVENDAAAALIWPTQEYDFFVNMQSPWIQRTGFVIRKNSVKVEHVKDMPELGVAFNGNHPRHGQEIQIKTKTGMVMKLLSVHLKSGCFDKALDSDYATKRDAEANVKTCSVLKHQVPALENWLDSNLKAGFQAMILGDFNRRFDSAIEHSTNAKVSMFAELSDGKPTGSTLFRPTVNFKAVADCQGAGSSLLIDHALLSSGLKAKYIQNSVKQLAVPLRGSDHCPLRFSMKL